MKMKIRSFKVRQDESRLSFPLDMLRRDCCWPADSESAVTIALTLDRSIEPDETATVSLTGIQEPNRERWTSFSWTVI